MTPEPFELVIDGAVIAGDHEGSGPDLLWAHGLGSSRRDEDGRGVFGWAASGARITRYDARGHGRTARAGAPAPSWSWDLFASDLLAVSAARDLPPCVVGGASLGAATAVLAALLRPDRVTGLLLVTPPAIWADRGPMGDAYRAGADLADSSSLAALRAVVADAPLPPVLALDSAQPPTALDVDESSFAAVLRGVADSDLPPPATLGDIAVPTLVLAWDDDPDHPLSSAAALTAAIPEARLVVARDLAAVRRWPTLAADLLRRA